MPLLRQEYATRVRLNRLRSRVSGPGKHFRFARTDVANVAHEESDRYLLQELVDHLRERAGDPTCGGRSCSSGLGRLDANASERHEDVAGGPCGDPHTP